MSLGLGLGLGLTARGGVQNPIRALFKSGEQGLWLDPSDLSTMFQDAAGTTPVAADGDPVGLIRDKSGNGNDFKQTTDASRPLYKTDGTLHWLAFDGTDDFLVSGATIDFSGGDKVSIFMGAYKASDATFQAFYELSASISANVGSFYQGNRDAVTANWVAAARGAATFVAGDEAAFTSFVAPDTAVLSMQHDIAGDLSTIRRNGVAGTSGTADKGTGNFGNYSLYVGSRAGTVQLLNGKIYGLIIRAGLTDAASVSKVERWLAPRTGVTL